LSFKQADVEGITATKAASAPASAREQELQVCMFCDTREESVAQAEHPHIKVLHCYLRMNGAHMCAAQAQLQQAHAELDAWRKALAGDTSSSAAAASPAAAAAALQKGRDDAAAAQAQAQLATQRAGGLEFALSEKNLENVQLRRSLHAARQAADPSIVQARCLCLCLISSQSALPQQDHLATTTGRRRSLVEC
jgi:DNA-binding NarL/FixJ family response regulator